MNRFKKPEHQISDDEVVARAQRAMVRAGQKALAEYRRAGIDPVVAEFPLIGELKARKNSRSGSR